jgi:exosortase/archaeosortase family protein
VVLTVVPLAMLANVVRVVGTVLLVSRIGPQAAQGLLHEAFGLATYAVGTVALVLVARLLR